MCCSQPMENGARELILDNCPPPLKKKKTKKQVTTECKCKGVHRERTPCQTEQKGPHPFVCESFRRQSFFTVSFHDTLAGAHGSVSERVPTEVPRVFSGFCFTVHSMLVLSCLTFHGHKREYRPLKWTKEGESGRAGPQH